MAKEGGLSLGMRPDCLFIETVIDHLLFHVYLVEPSSLPFAFVISNISLLWKSEKLRITRLLKIKLVWWMTVSITEIRPWERVANF